MGGGLGSDKVGGGVEQARTPPIRQELKPGKPRDEQSNPMQLASPYMEMPDSEDSLRQ